MTIDMAKCLVYQLIDLVESYHDTVNSTREIYAGSISLQLNDTMRLLTVFSTILLPLTFITSIFGMQGFDLNNIQSIPQGFRVICIRTNNNSITNELWLHIEKVKAHILH